MVLNTRSAIEGPVSINLEQGWIIITVEKNWKNLIKNSSRRLLSFFIKFFLENLKIHLLLFDYVFFKKRFQQNLDKLLANTKMYLNILLVVVL